MRPFLILAAVLPFATGCAHVNETRERIVLERRPVVLSEMREPSRDLLIARAEARREEVVVRVDRVTACARTVGEERVIRETVDRGVRDGRLATDATLAVTGFALATGTIMFAAVCHQPNVEGGQQPCGGILLFFPLAAGVVLTAVGASLLMADAGHESHTSRTYRERIPGASVDRSPCSRTSVTGALVEIALPDGSRLSGRMDAEGDAHVNVPDSVWATAGDVLDANILVDGLLLRRATLKRPGP